MLATLTLAAEETSRTPFYVFAICLVGYAVILSSIGIARHETFPPSRAAARGIMLLAVLLVAGTMTTAVLTA